MGLINFVEVDSWRWRANDLDLFEFVQLSQLQAWIGSLLYQVINLFGYLIRLVIYLIWNMEMRFIVNKVMLERS